jgi:tetratricopeptide (TPR) repeat protein
VSFRHELARQAVETSLHAGERLRINGDVLALLLERPGVEPTRIVHHADKAGRGDVLCAHGPAAAAAATQAGAHRQAAEILRVVLQHGGDTIDEATVADLLTRRAYSLYVVNQFDAAIECGQAAVSTAERAGNPTALVDALLVLAKAAYWAPGPSAARRAAQRALTLLESSGDRPRLASALIDAARACSNLATLGVVAEPNPESAQFAERALELAEQLGRDDLRSQALCYLGAGRLACGDERGRHDMDRAIALSATEPRAEFRVRIYVNAAGSAYRAGRLQDAERYVTAGLRLAPDSDFVAGEYRLRLTAAAIHATAGEWEQAVDELRDLVASADAPGVMRLMARALLARLLARRGDTAAAGEVLNDARHHPAAVLDSFVAAPLAAAEVELAWLTGAWNTVPPFVDDTLALAQSSGHLVAQGELCTYLRRAGHAVDAPIGVPEPWASALSGQWRDAADAWGALGERYERAIELGWSGDDNDARAEGLDELDSIGARAAAALIRSRRE